MKLCCYWKEDNSDLEGIAHKIYDLCMSIYRINPNVFNSWIISFKRQWAFKASSTSLSEFIQQITEGVWQEDKAYLKRKGWDFSSKIKDEAGFGISLSCVIGSKESIHFRCLMGVYDNALINSCVVTFPKNFSVETELVKSIVLTLSPQWATLTEQVLYDGIAEFSKDIVPGYWMYFSDFSRLPSSSIFNNFSIYNEQGAIFLQISHTNCYSFESRQNAEVLSKYFKDNNIDFWTFLV